MYRVVAIIPARGGSKGIPRKNIKPFCGKPLIVHSIEAGLNSQTIDEVYVSTEDIEIATVSVEAGAKIIDRPADFASDTASTFSVVRHAAQVLHFPDVMVTLQPTSPLRTATHIDEAVVLLQPSVDTVVGVCATHRYYWDIKNGYGVPNFQKRLPRQLMEANYFENGALYVTRKEVIEKNDNRLGMGISSSVR